MNKIYLDNAATTPLSEEVIDAMVDTMKMNFGNPSSTHSFGQEAKILIENVRRQIADYLHVTPAEIIFTSCGTESNNMIIKSSVEHLGVERIISSPLEHKCVSESILDMKNRKGVEVNYIRPDEKGDIDLGRLEELLKGSDKKTLVSLMHANNEIGNLTDIKRVAELCRQYNALFHSDTVQTMAHMNLDFSEIMVDFASCSAHKFHGPKGIGFAFIRKATGLKGIITGGPQERSLRAGTENVAGIVGLGKALELSLTHMNDYKDHMQAIKDYAIEKLSAAIPGIKFNGRSSEKNNSLYTVLSALLPYKNPLIGLQLDMKGIAISQGSACSSGASKPSMVMMMVLTEDEMDACTPLRISFSHLTTKADIDSLTTALKEISENFVIEKTNVEHR
ncbi:MULTISPECIES: cysteine desulfurase family protein [Chryseobacterium]|uniref:cysteine desulfurase n=1 Tax=Chryseobacterium camelliae TaxID=1265445 RepID=A0ABU0TJZ7_9FLAO|nr:MULTISPECIES: cysteine desulfurase family protein [Chryseobacterium]MDT3409016.1 cysteine desulfurase [Pseudacidovorax intermedius]MDQ1097126.1 cysteine desulfurase [Chryseobacterium camelliae]MDQ1101063.1 cysteine desulfurase [Chryseobacterium sp. SORGH_AS_1048]MDR6084506.1 cysteine desulfurase [Chryseobacterium sp. SORGH_AS_0909]MDR6132776.1 cysteine desulfurase [Chryseobacterium sp. SORGH_AS_1175]